MRIAVIGAGPAGLAALKVFQEYVGSNDLVAFEAQNELGGTWLYSESSKEWFASSIYANLVTNLPPEQMQYPSMPFPQGTDQFPHHTVVLKYLLAFAERFQLRKYIRFNTTVEECYFDDGIWRLTLNDGTQQEFDYLVVANGHFRSPRIPKDLTVDPSIQLIHSRDYRHPSKYQGKTVVIVGAGSSAFDIAREIAPGAKLVAISMRNTASSGDLGETVHHLRPKRPDGSLADIIPKGPIKSTSSGGLVEFNDGSVLEGVDVIMFCTGFDFKFPFFKQSIYSTPSTRLLDQEGLAVYNLYREMIYIPNSTLAFLGVNHKIWPFPVFEYQATLLAHFWTKQIAIPSVEDMRRHEEDECRRWNYLPGSKESHRFGPERQHEYLLGIYNDLTTCERVPHLPKPTIDLEKRNEILKARKQRLGY